MKYNGKELTMEEKMRLLIGKNNWQSTDCNGKVPTLSVSDGPIGLRKTVVNDKGQSYALPAVAFPATQILANTWDLSLAYAVGASIADECIEADIDILLGPGCNIKRSPMCGRNFEYYSEDPYVSGTFAREFIKGVQSKGVGTSLKHYCANNLEFGRVYTSSEVDERTLTEIYLESFRIACEADPATVMCGYNLVNGQRMSEHKKLYRILREDFWREDGVIISDWGAVHDRTRSLKAGLDIEMPYSEIGYENLKAGYESGRITEEDIDKSVERILKLAQKYGERKERNVTTTKEDRRRLAQRVAEEGIVLLKNNGVLPLADRGKIMISGNDLYAYYSGAGSSRVVTENEPQTLLQCLRSVLPNATIDGYTVTAYSDSEYLPMFEMGYENDVAIVVCGDYETEGDDRYSMRLPIKDERLILETAKRNANTVVVLRYGAAVDVSSWIDKVAAVIFAGYGGERGNEALANILSGKVNPSGRLTETFANTYEDYPVAHTYLDHAINAYTEGLFMGYRYFDNVPANVRFPFGYGLSYSQFQYSDLVVNRQNDTYEVRFRVSNVSTIDGVDVAQVYIHEVQPRVLRPIKELKGFERVVLKAGESKEVCVKLSHRAFAYYSVAEDCWKVTSGKFEIYIAQNANDIRLQTCIEVSE